MCIFIINLPRKITIHLQTDYRKADLPCGGYFFEHESLESNEYFLHTESE